MARNASVQTKVGFTVLAWAVALLLFSPILWTIVTAFKTEAEAIATFLESRVAGLVLVSDHVPERDILALARARHPIVLINRAIPELAAHAIRIDNVYSGALATRHLLELGHTRIAHVAGILSRSGARERLEGYHLALR